MGFGMKYHARSRNIRRLGPPEADTLKAITDLLEVLQKQGKLLYIRHSPSNVILSWKLIGEILRNLYHHEITISSAFNKIKSSCFRKLPESQLGVVDLIVFRQMRPVLGWHYIDVLCIEVKSPKGDLSPAQARWGRLAIHQGCRCLIARSVDDVIQALRELP